MPKQLGYLNPLSAVAKIKSLAPQNEHRQKWLVTNGSAEALWLAKRYPTTIISVFVIGFRLVSLQAATELSTRE